MIAGRLTMRAHVERSGVAGKDGWGQPVPAAPAAIGVIHCFVWSTASRKVVDGDKTAMIEDVRGLFARAADLRPGDEIAKVTDRLGRITFAGRLKVEGPVQSRGSHLEAALKRID
ncbi:hypothetical protein [Sphingomonas sp. VNH70]|uniref:hypothetical protein n=1 Tax=Sphingomonas silueang TaxID=3156617 RepID=UPI0032B327F8